MSLKGIEDEIAAAKKRMVCKASAEAWANVQATPKSQGGELDPARCPLCGNDNDCGVVAGKVCWCERAYIPEDVRKALPEHLRGKVCICKACAVQLSRERESC